MMFEIPTATVVVVAVAWVLRGVLVEHVRSRGRARRRHTTAITAGARGAVERDEDRGVTTS